MNKNSILTCALLLSFFSSRSQESQDTSLPKGWWHIPKTPVRFKVGGYVKADLIHDFNPIASPDYFDVSKIPTDGSEGQTTHFNLKETRLLLDVRTPTKKGDIRAYIESDFYGSNGSFRIRHAFVDIHDKLLVGQWWSNFMDENIIPNTLDFEKPVAYAFARHGMIRWKQKLSNKSYLALALEEPNANAVAPTQPGKFYNPLPDFTARYRYTGHWGHVQLSGFVGALQYRYTAGGKDDVTLYGFNLSTQIRAGKRDYFQAQLLAGPGVGRMRSGLSAATDANDQLRALNEFGYTVLFCHFWTPALSSLVMYNTGYVDNSAGQTGDNIRHVQYAAANLIWQFAPNTMAGIEYLWGQRIDKNDASGHANRIQFSVKHSFNMN
jgi:hypothetical protein